MSGSVSVIVGGMAGSEAKGAVTAEIIKYKQTVAINEGKPSPACVRVSGPNAGHTAIDSQGTEWKLRQVPIGAVFSDGPLVIAAQSEIDPEVLLDEVDQLDAAGYDVSNRLVVDTECTIIDDEHKAAEAALVGRIGSTGKGIGAARAARLLRQARLVRDLEWQFATADTQAMLLGCLSHGRHVSIEGAQGYILGLHAGLYPQCTSNNSRAIDCLSYAGISPWDPRVEAVEPWVVLRTYPIRVAGNSGPMYKELTWDEMSERTGGHAQPELTTVTRKVRRIGEWDAAWARRSVEANGGRGCSVALSFVDYEFPDHADSFEALEDPKVEEFVSNREREIGAPIRMVGTGQQSYIWRVSDDMREFADAVLS